MKESLAVTSLVLSIVAITSLTTFNVDTLLFPSYVAVVSIVIVSMTRRPKKAQAGELNRL